MEKRVPRGHQVSRQYYMPSLNFMKVVTEQVSHVIQARGAHSAVFGKLRL